jgi:hypothetical protein
MSTTDTLENAHLLVTQTVDDLPEALWDLPGADGEWTVKDIIGNLTAYELVLIDAIKTVQGETPTPYLLRWHQSQQEFDEETAKTRRYQTAQQVLDGYQDAQIQSTSLLANVPEGKVEQKGTMSWLNDDSTLADLVSRIASYTQQRCDQIVQFREKNKQLE